MFFYGDHPLTLFPRRGFRLANSPRARASVRAPLLAPWASGVAPGLIWTARAPATIVLERDGGVKTPILHSAALQPGVARKAKICHTKTVNIDLICSDGAQRALEMSTRIAEGALQAAASDDNVFGESQKAGAKPCRTERPHRGRCE
jgi:hypothetical protein